jgi:hypothetical protein
MRIKRAYDLDCVLVILSFYLSYLLLFMALHTESPKFVCVEINKLIKHTILTLMCNSMNSI